MTNEEPVPSTSSVLSATEKNVKIVNGSKKRKGLDIDALWRKKFKDVEIEKSPAEKPPKEAGKKEERTVEKPAKKDEQVDEEKSEKSQRGNRPLHESQNGTKKMDETTEDVKTNAKVPKKAAPSFQCAAITDGTVNGAGRRSSAMIVDPSKITLNDTFGDESQEEMEVMSPLDDETQVEYEQYAGEYPQNVATPNGSSYAIYAADTPQYPQYYQYPTMQSSSPQDPGAYLTVHSSAQPGDAQSPVNSTIDEDGLSNNPSGRAAPATIQWLLDNYETAEGSSLPRCQLYDHYRKHCDENRMEPVNAASFGKLIRSVFLNLKTRRLGTRGNSKYHYYGIRIKDSSILNDVTHTPMPHFVPQMTQRDAYADTVNQVAAAKYLHEEPPMKKGRKDMSSSSSSCRESTSPSELRIQPSLHQTTSMGVLPHPILAQPLVGVYVFTESDKAALGNLDMPKIPFDNLESFVDSIEYRKLGLASEVLGSFVESYSFMCAQILDLVKNVDFAAVEDIWCNFYSGMYGATEEEIVSLCTLQRVQEHVIEVDLALYQTMVDTLIPNVILTELTAGMTQSCRTFAKNIDKYMLKSVENRLDPAFVKKKTQALHYMQQGLKRYTSLNHLAHAARGVLQKPEQVAQMAIDYGKVDINAVHRQAGWICGCDFTLVEYVNTSFKGHLEVMSTMEAWAEWLESIVDQILANSTTSRFYTSTIIRDLTLRSAMSFGSFTLIRLLADDYMYYLIEAKIAKAGRKQLITVIRQERDYAMLRNNGEYIQPEDPQEELH
ncbi:unnamed protein product [Caenorhabditis sp. 36 PRJEB53466]|nr:unnamed protein product [Caenorhabditis sp. 36 PRJEB53466]